MSLKYFYPNGIYASPTFLKGLWGLYVIFFLIHMRLGIYITAQNIPNSLPTNQTPIFSLNSKAKTLWISSRFILESQNTIK